MNSDYIQHASLSAHFLAALASWGCGYSTADFTTAKACLLAAAPNQQGRRSTAVPAQPGQRDHLSGRRAAGPIRPGAAGRPIKQIQCRDHSFVGVHPASHGRNCAEGMGLAMP